MSHGLSCALHKGVRSNRCAETRPWKLDWPLPSAQRQDAKFKAIDWRRRPSVALVRRWLHLQGDPGSLEAYREGFVRAGRAPTTEVRRALRLQKQRRRGGVSGCQVRAKDVSAKAH